MPSEAWREVLCVPGEHYEPAHAYELESRDEMHQLLETQAYPGPITERQEI